MSSWLEFLQARGARIADGRVADFGDKARELSALEGIRWHAIGG